MEKYEVLYSEDGDTEIFSDCKTSNKDLAEDRVLDLQEEGYIAWIKKEEE